MLISATVFLRPCLQLANCLIFWSTVHNFPNGKSVSNIVQATGALLTPLLLVSSPNEFLTHHLPLMFFAGLESQSALSAPGEPAQVSSKEPFEGLIENLRSVLASKPSHPSFWIPRKPLQPTSDYRVLLVSKVFFFSSHQPSNIFLIHSSYLYKSSQSGSLLGRLDLPPSTVPPLPTHSLTLHYPRYLNPPHSFPMESSHLFGSGNIVI